MSALDEGHPPSPPHHDLRTHARFSLAHEHVSPQAHPRPVRAYYAALAQFQLHGHTTEGNTRSAFTDLLKKCCSPYGWHLVEEKPFKGTGGQSLRADGALVDPYTLVHGLWEAKDSGDDLKVEVRKKVERGYPIQNTLFQSPAHAVLYQASRIAFDQPITAPEQLVEVLQLFFDYQQPDIPDWKEAVDKFSGKIAELAEALNKTLSDEHRRNAAFRDNFVAFGELCRQSINPDLSDASVRQSDYFDGVRLYTHVSQQRYLKGD